MFSILNGSLQGRNQTRILGLEQDLQVSWVATFEGYVGHEAGTISDNTNAIVVVIEDPSECPIISINQSDGTSLSQASVTSMDSCQTIAKTDDGQYFVVSGLGTGSQAAIVILNSSDMTHQISIQTGLASMKVVSTRVISSNSHLGLVITGLNTSPSDHITHYDFDVDSNSLRWGKGLY